MKHVRRDRSALRLVAIKQRFRRTRERGGQLPAEIISVLNAGIETLTTGWRVNMSGIPAMKVRPIR